jgi:hypothetical protein
MLKKKPPVKKKVAPKPKPVIEVTPVEETIEPVATAEQGITVEAGDTYEAHSSTEEESAVEKPIENKTKKYYDIFSNKGISRNAHDPNEEYKRGKELLRGHPELALMTSYLRDYVGL